MAFLDIYSFYTVEILGGVYLKSCNDPYIPQPGTPNKSLADCILQPRQELCGRLNGQGEEDSEFPRGLQFITLNDLKWSKWCQGSMLV